MSMKGAAQIEALEVSLVLDAVRRMYGYDFQAYAPGVLAKRLRAFASREGVQGLSGLIGKLLRDEACMRRLNAALVNDPSLFGGAALFKRLRDELIPRLRTYPSVRVWVPACGNSAADAYALAVLFEEAGLAPRARIYATDAAEPAIARASRGEFSQAAVRRAEAEYARGGGPARLLKHFTRSGAGLRLRPRLRAMLFFGVHNLASDASINEFQLILFRNRLVDMGPSMQSRAAAVLDASLARFGSLILGENEALPQSPVRKRYERMYDDLAVYSKIVEAT